MALPGIRRTATGWHAAASNPTRRGWHLVYKMPAGLDLRCSTSKLAQGVDIRASGGYVIWWPAAGLTAVGGLDDLTAPPRWLLDELIPATPPVAAASTAAPSGSIAEGRRNDFLSREAFRLKKQGCDPAQIAATLRTLNETRCSPPLEAAEVAAIAAGKARIEPDASPLVVTDFFAYMPENKFIFVPTRELWPAASVDARIAPVVSAGETIKASKHIALTRPIDQMTWAPGEPMVIRDRVVKDGGWSAQPGRAVFNLYQAPSRHGGTAANIAPWREHLARIYPDDAAHITHWLAHRVQRPGEKLNHALVLGGAQGIGKDTLLEPVKYAIGAWNFQEVSPKATIGRFNGFVKSVILRISEARDLGDIDRYEFYEATKVYLAAPPDTLRCDEKNIREHAVFNVMGVIVTTNNKTNGIFLPSDDRRHYVAWTDATKEDFTATYWRDIWRWYATGGLANVTAYLAGLDLSGFDPKAPPPRTPAWREIVESNRAPEDAAMADALDALDNPPAITLAMVASRASEELRDFLLDRRNARAIPHQLETAGYVAVINDTAKDGYYVISGKRMPVYALRTLPVRDRIVAATALSRRRG